MFMTCNFFAALLSFYQQLIKIGSLYAVELFLYLQSSAYKKDAQP
jgi:hypothetical protein